MKLSNIKGDKSKWLPNDSSTGNGLHLIELLNQWILLESLNNPSFPTDTDCSLQTHSNMLFMNNVHTLLNTKLLKVFTSLSQCPNYWKILHIIPK